MGCTYERKQLGFDAWPNHTRAHFAPACVLGGPIPGGFWVVWEGPPYRPHSLGNDSKCRRGKGLKTVCIASTRTSDGLLNLDRSDTHRNGNVFLGYTMWDVHTNGNDWVSMRRPIAHELILPRPVSQEGLSPTVSGSCGKDPPIAHTHLATVPNVVAERG